MTEFFRLSGGGNDFLALVDRDGTIVDEHASTMLMGKLDDALYRVDGAEGI